MKNHIATIECAAVLSRKPVDTINRVAGHIFDNGAIEIDFNGVRAEAKPPPKCVKFHLNQQGIEAQGYITTEIVQQLLAVDVQYLDSEYISYLLAQKTARYGISHIHYEAGEVCAPQAMIDAYFRVGDIAVKVTLSVKDLLVEERFLHPKSQVLSGQIKLSVSYAPFDTQLRVEEIAELTKHDLVLVYPK